MLNRIAETIVNSNILTLIAFAFIGLLIAGLLTAFTVSPGTTLLGAAWIAGIVLVYRLDCRQG